MPRVIRVVGLLCLVAVRGAFAQSTVSAPCNLAMVLGSYGVQCHGTVFTGVATEPVTIVGTVTGDEHGMFEGHTTMNSGAGSIRVHNKGPVTLLGCFGRVVYTVNDLLLPDGSVVSLPPLVADAAMVEDGLELLGSGVEPNGVAGDLVPRLVCRLVRVEDPVARTTNRVLIRATVDDMPLEVPIRFDHGGHRSTSGTLATPYLAAPPIGGGVTVSAEAVVRTRDGALLFRRWDVNGTDRGATNPLVVPVPGPSTITAIYHAVDDAVLTVRLQSMTGATLAGTVSVATPALGSVTAPASITLAALQPFTVTAPASLGSCAFLRFVNPATGFSTGSRTLTGSVLGDQERIAQYRCP